MPQAPSTSYRRAPRPHWICLGWLVYPYLFLARDETLNLSWLSIFGCLVTGFILLHGIIAAHELGHIIAGQTAGIEFSSFHIGSGFKLAEFNIAKVKVTWKLFPSYGFVRPLQSRHLLSLTRCTLFFAGGVIAEILMGWALWYTYSHENLHDLIWSVPLVRYLFITAVIFLIATIGASAWPATHTIEGIPLDNDSLLIWKLWTTRRDLPTKRRLLENWQRYTELIATGDIVTASDHAKRLLLENPDDPAIHLTISRLFELQGDLDDAREILERILKKIPKASPFRTQALDLLVCLVLNYGKTEWLEDANQWSIQALEEAPDSVTLKGTRGSVLAELGRNPEAQTLLHEVMNSTESDNDRAYCLAYLGWIDAQRGNYTLANEKIEKAKAFKLQISAVPRLEKIIAALGNSPAAAS